MTSTSIALNMIRGTYLVGGDFTEGSISNSVAETELLDYDIPANTVTNGIIIIVVWAAGASGVGDSNNATIKIKTGTNGSETLRLTISRRIPKADGKIQEYNAWYVEDSLDWTLAQTVSITGQNSESEGDSKTHGNELIVLGY